MELKTIYLVENTKFGKTISEWAENKGFEIKFAAQKNSDLYDVLDGVVLFHENHNFLKEDIETLDSLTKGNRLAHKVDLNGTISATLSNFNMWLSLNKPKNLMFIGAEDMIKNANLSLFLDRIEA
ncbi:MAG TPA: hypothetical protein VL021_02465 [Brumimicrobium sp.]|nr:hypothetical protein [Brumimicrobium sp.]